MSGFASGELRFDGKVALITGAGAGLGRQYALLLASRGAKIVVNDLGGSMDGTGSSSRAADLVVDEIKAMGGEAVPDYNNVVEGAKLVDTAIKAYGRIDIIVNNAGILRDVSFAKMTDEQWQIILDVHLRGAYSVCHAAWPHMRKQKYGRIINVTSTSGLFGNFGQANYSAAKMGVVGLSTTLAKEGAKSNIKVNTLGPGAGSRMTESVMPKEMVDAWKPEFVAPMVIALAHESCPATGQIFQAGGGWYSQVSWQRSDGYLAPPEKTITAEELVQHWAEVTDLPAKDGVPEQFGGTHHDRQLDNILSKM